MPVRVSGFEHKIVYTGIRVLFIFSYKGIILHKKIFCVYIFKFLDQFCTLYYEARNIHSCSLVWQNALHRRWMTYHRLYVQTINPSASAFACSPLRPWRFWSLSLASLVYSCASGKKVSIVTRSSGVPDYSLAILRFAHEGADKGFD